MTEEMNGGTVAVIDNGDSGAIVATLDGLALEALNVNGNVVSASSDPVLAGTDTGDIQSTVELSEPTDLGASKPVEKPYRHRGIPVQHPTVVACGHKLEAGHFPRHVNCYDCWYALFETTPDGVSTVHEILTNMGTQALISHFGKKFVKFFGAYLRSKMFAAAIDAAEKAEDRKDEEVSIEGSIMNVAQEAQLGLR